MTDLPTCPSTGKLSFLDKKHAKKANRWRVRNGKHEIKFMEAYMCRFCPYWHLTSGKKNRL